MGASEFQTFQEGVDPEDAFRLARQQAQFEYGHNGYTGTIAEKYEFVIIEPEPRPIKQAREEADRYLNCCDRRISDKFGPCGAIRVFELNEDATPLRNGWLFLGVAKT